MKGLITMFKKIWNFLFRKRKIKYYLTGHKRKSYED